MKSNSAIFLSLWITLISFFPKTDTCHLLDFGVLAEHFQEHRQKDSINIWQFLWLHYAHTEHRKQDQNHKQLPLQHHHAECISLIIYPNASFEINHTPIIPTIQAPSYISWQSFYYFQLTKENFQPPRV